jgi:predicted alpha/beta superfamily hydrolase
LQHDFYLYTKWSKLHIEKSNTDQMKYFPAILVAALLAITPCTLAQQPTDPQPVPLPASELRKLHSNLMGQDFLIYVQLPLNYIPDGSKEYPVLYVTEGNRSFPTYANISTIIGFPDTGFPQVIVVGIAYDIETMLDWAVGRTRDLTPVEDAGTEQYWEGLLRGMSGDQSLEVTTGGAPLFLSFICDELVPFIDSAYPVDPGNRALGGYSYGGLFSLFALFEHPGMFQRYFAGSPSIHYADRVMFEVEQAYSETHTDLPARLFLTMGGLEDESGIDNMKRMEEVLKSRNYPSLEVYSQIFEGEHHVSAYPASIMRAFFTLYGE